MNTIRYTSETPSPALIMARIKAGCRLTDAATLRRMAENEYASAVLETLRLEGAVTIGVKVCGDDGKYRYAMTVSGEGAYDEDYLMLSLRSTYRADCEIWGVRADGSYCNSVF